MADADNYKIKIKDLALFVGNKHVVLDVIHVSTGNRIYFDFYTLDGVFTAGLFKSFDVTHSYGRI
jgi:hypothetical protein